MGAGTAEDNQQAVRRALTFDRQGDRRVRSDCGRHPTGNGLRQTGGVRHHRPVVAIGIAVAFLAAVTLLPAILVVAGPRGWVAPRRERAARLWRRTGMRIVRRPKASSVRESGPAAGSGRRRRADSVSTTTTARQLPDSVDSSIGYAALDRALPGEPVDPRIPAHPVSTRPTHSVGARGLGADGGPVSQTPDIAAISGITRPPKRAEQFRATYQAGESADRWAAVPP